MPRIASIYCAFLPTPGAALAAARASKRRCPSNLTHLGCVMPPNRRLATAYSTIFSTLICWPGSCNVFAGGLT